MSEPTDPFAPPGAAAGQASPPQQPASYTPSPQPGGYHQAGQLWGPGQPPGPYGAPAQTSTKAVVALALAIGAYTPVIPFIGAIIALVVAASAKRDILASGGTQTGLDLCTWAKVLSIVHLVFVGLLLLLVFPVVLLLPFSFS